MKPSPQAVFFDLFSTLLHFDYSILPEVHFRGEPLRTTSVEVHSRVVEEFGVASSLETFLEAAMVSRKRVVSERGPEEREFPCLYRFQLLAEELGLEREGLAEAMVETHMDQMLQMMYLPEENRAVLRALSHLPLVLASNFDHAPTVRRALDEFEIGGAFDYIFVSDELGWRKPGRNFFEAILKVSGFDPGRSVFVGDDPLCDLWGASRMGFATAWLVGDGSSDPPVEPTWRLKRLPDLLGVLPAF